MRALGVAATTVVTLVVGGLAGAAAADDPTPTRQQVADAQAAVRGTALDVQGVRARLAVANQRLEQSGMVAAQAAEAYNGARYRAGQARRAAAVAEQAADRARADVTRQRTAYADGLVTSYEIAPQLSALSSLTRAQGIDEVLQGRAALDAASQALEGNYDEFRAAAVLAEVSSRRAERARAEAVAAQRQARAARDEAQRAADAAAAAAQQIAAEKSALLARLARLQHVSVELAQRRQSALEERARRAAEAAARAAAQKAAQDAAPTPASETDQPAPSADPTPAPAPAPTPDPAPDPAPAPAPKPAPSPRGGASAAIAFARAQIGEPYRWGAAGPGAWDCSGLVMGAWAAGGRSLPHYSVAQYEQSTPIRASELRPGDLVFWGSSSSPSSIYHVALYAGGGRIIEAPRTGVPVREQSMYSWTVPNFYARP